MAAIDIINDGRGYAGDMAAASALAVDQAVSAVRGIGYVVPNYQPTQLPDAPPSTLDLTPPELDPITMELPAEPGDAPTPAPISAIDTSGAPMLQVGVPALVLPSAPAALNAFQDQAPQINTNLQFPEPPALLMQPPTDVPELPDRGVPVAPNVVLPVFDAVMPADTTQSPTDLDGRLDAAYRSAAPQMMAMLDGQVDALIDRFNPEYRPQMAKVEAQLSRFMAGGSGFAPAVEDAIYGRARDKNLAEARRVEQAAREDMADRGFTLPPGALMASARAARQAAADTNAAAAADIVRLQAEMEQRNLQFAVTTSAGLRSSMLQAALGYHQNLIAINGQALDYGKAVLSAVVETYNTAVRAFTAKLEAYRAEAAVFETRLKGAMAAVELYRAEIDALQALTNVDRAKVDVFRARIDVLSALANVYRSQIDAVQGRAGLEKLKLELFQSRVQAYTSQVQAKNAEWGGYQSAIQGQAELVRVYSARVQAYGTEVAGWRAKIEAQAEVVKAQATSNQAQAEQFRAQVSAYSAVVNARGDLARTQVQVGAQQLQAFSAKANAEVAKAQVANEYYRAVSYVVVQNARNSLDAQIKHADSAMNFGRTVAELSNTNARTYGTMASAALSGLNSLAAEIKNE